MSITSGGFSDNSAGGGFPDSFAGNQGTMLLNALKSLNFVTGVSGWEIQRNGNAEFNNLTIRGTFNGTKFIINSSGAFFYSGTPGSTTLAIAIAPAATTDPYGTSVMAGVWLYGSSLPLIGLNPSSDSLDITEPGIVRFLSGAAFEQNPAEIIAAVGGISPAQYIAMAIESASTTTAGAHDRVRTQYNSAADDNSSSANLDFVYTGSNGVDHEQAFLDITGFNILAGSIVAVHPGSSPATPESWTTITLQNGYTAGTNNGFTDVPQVRLMADNKNLQFKGTLKSPAAGFAAPWGTLPASYPNANMGGLYGKGLIANLTGGIVDHVQVQNNTNLSLANPGGGNNYDISCIVPTQ